MKLQFDKCLAIGGLAEDWFQMTWSFSALLATLVPLFAFRVKPSRDWHTHGPAEVRPRLAAITASPKGTVAA